MEKQQGTKQYDYNELLEKTIEIAKKYELTIVEEIIAYLPCCKKTFYNYKLHELHELKDVVDHNKVKMKQKLRKIWLDEGSASERIALYKLLGTSDERDALNGRVEEKGDSGKVEVVIHHKQIKSREDLDND